MHRGGDAFYNQLLKAMTEVSKLHPPPVSLGPGVLRDFYDFVTSWRDHLFPNRLPEKGKALNTFFNEYRKEAELDEEEWGYLEKLAPQIIDHVRMNDGPGLALRFDADQRLKESRVLDFAGYDDRYFDNYYEDETGTRVFARHTRATDKCFNGPKRLHCNSAIPMREMDREEAEALRDDYEDMTDTQYNNPAVRHRDYVPPRSEWDTFDLDQWGGPGF